MNQMQLTHIFTQKHHQNQHQNAPNLIVHFENWWNSFSPQHSILTSTIQQVCPTCNIIITTLHPSSHTPDLILSSIFGPIPSHSLSSSPIRILYIGENLNLPGYSHWKSALYRSSLKPAHFLFGNIVPTTQFHPLSFTDLLSQSINTINLSSIYASFSPEWIDTAFQHLSYIHSHQNPNTSLIQTHTKSIAFLARSNLFQFRTKLIASINSLPLNSISIDCPSKLNKNMKSLRKLNLTKIQFLSQYKFNLCPENSLSFGYVTEKLLDASLSGAIPIYCGGKKHFVLDRIFNLDRIVMIPSMNQKGIDVMLKKLEILLKNESLLSDFFAKPIYSQSAIECIMRLIVERRILLQYAVHIALFNKSCMTKDRKESLESCSDRVQQWINATSQSEIRRTLTEIHKQQQNLPNH
uniref:Fucosyltransferase n=1 Tax=Timspurckia oligopyrenoides TaxID=708627 RepID=A0A7S1ETV4_9RHOD